jgi:hypothetical protein
MVFKLSNLQISEAAQNLKIHSFSSAKLVQHPPPRKELVQSSTKQVCCIPTV